MIPVYMVDMLEQASEKLRMDANGAENWQDILRIFEEAICKAKANQFFSVQEASSIYQERFPDNIDDSVCTLIANVQKEAVQGFCSVLLEYGLHQAWPYRAIQQFQTISHYADITEELINFILAGESFPEEDPVTVNTHTAKELCGDKGFSPVEAYYYLAYIRAGSPEHIH